MSAQEPSVAFDSNVSEPGYRRVLVRVALLRMRWVLPFAAYFGFAALGRGDVGMAWLWLAMSSGALVVVIGYARWSSGSPSANKSVYAPVHYIADETGLSYETAAGAGRVEWEQVHRWQHVADHYLLYVGSASYLLVAGESLDAVDAREGFEALVRAHVPRRSLKTLLG